MHPFSHFQLSLSHYSVHIYRQFIYLSLSLSLSLSLIPHLLVCVCAIVSQLMLLLRMCLCASFCLWVNTDILLIHTSATTTTTTGLCPSKVFGLKSYWGCCYKSVYFDCCSFRSKFSWVHVIPIIESLESALQHRVDYSTTATTQVSLVYFL